MGICVFGKIIEGTCIVYNVRTFNLGDNPLLDCQSLNSVDGERTGSTMQIGNSKFHIFGNTADVSF